MTIDVGGPINAPSAPVTIGGVTLSEFRQRLRIELSNYSANSLISNANPDTELQFINDGIGQLYPYDFQIVNRSIPVIASQNIYYLPSDVEHVFTVSSANKDINQGNVTVSRIPHGEGWTYQADLVDASTVLLEDGVTSWVDGTHKAINIDTYLVGSYSAQLPYYAKYLIVRYARRWAPLTLEIDAVDPSPSRIQAIIYFACAQFFRSQQEVNSESVRYNNYVSLANQFTQQATAQLIRDPRQLYIL